MKRKRLTLNDTEQLSRQFGFDKADQDCLQKDYHMHALRDVYFGKVVFQTMDDASYSLNFDLEERNPSTIARLGREMLQNAENIAL